MDSIGIAGLGSYLPGEPVDAWQAVKASGVSRKKFDRIGCIQLHQAAEGEFPSDMAIEAGRRAIADAGLSPKDIDVVIYTGSVKDHARWQAAAKVQSELGCSDSWVFDIYQGCNGQIVALRLAQSLIRDDPDVDNVLITSAERYDSTLEYPIVGHTYLFGDGASALVVKRKHEDLTLQSSAFKTWGAHHHTFCVPGVGASAKLTPEALERGDHYLQIYKPLNRSHEELVAFGDQIIEIAGQLMEKAAAQASVSVLDIDFVVMVNGSLRHNEIFLERMGLADKGSTKDYIAETAHMGSPDVAYNLERARAEGKVEKGDLIALYTGGGGYTWTITLVRF